LPSFSFLADTDKPVILGIGGLHHAPSFSKRTGKFYVGHVCPKYMLKTVTKESLLNAVKNTVPKVTHIVYDWKGMADKERIVPMVEEVAAVFDLILCRVKNFDSPP
jgi:D-tyrosyl-tRNA(Tyr) deacylase